jgi:hypothetical protein
LSHVLINLDDSGVTAAPIDVLIHGQTYTLPGDIPAPTYAKLLAIQDQARQSLEAGDDATEANRSTNLAMADELLELFRVYQPDLARLPLGVNEMVAAIGFIYSPASRGAEGNAGPKTPTRSRSTKTRTSTKPRASRSRSST